MAETEERFWTKVRKSDGCWLWIGSKKKGRSYGQFWHLGRMRRAHRVSWELHNGSIPDGLHVLHSCDNPTCVNPSHLFLGTHADNMADMSAKGRATAAHGSACVTAKLNWEKVTAIRWLYSAGKFTQRQLAQQFGVSQLSISRIAQNKTWKNADACN